MLNVCYDFVTDSEPIDIKIERPFGFVVKELPDVRKIRKYTFHKEHLFFIHILKKVNMNTLDTVKILESRGLKVGYAGLKDKNAVTYQYVSLDKKIDITASDIEVKFYAMGKWLSPGDLAGNRFELTLNKKIEWTPPDILPNYFGPQRFGGGNHVIGYKILRREIHPKFSKKMIKFYINAYQSWIFNELVKEAIKRGVLSGLAPLPGFASKKKKNWMWELIDRIHRDHGIKLSDYRINELHLTVMGSQRKLGVPIKNFTINDNKLAFELPPGSYATVLVNEIKKVRCNVDI